MRKNEKPFSWQIFHLLTKKCFGIRVKDLRRPEGGDLFVVFRKGENAQAIKLPGVVPALFSKKENRP